MKKKKKKRKKKTRQKKLNFVKNAWLKLSIKKT